MNYRLYKLLISEDIKNIKYFDKKSSSRKGKPVVDNKLGAVIFCKNKKQNPNIACLIEFFKFDSKTCYILKYIEYSILCLFNLIFFHFC